MGNFHTANNATNLSTEKICVFIANFVFLLTSVCWVAHALRQLTFKITWKMWAAPLIDAGKYDVF